MGLYATVTLVVGLTFLSEVSSVYYIEIVDGPQLQKENAERSRQAYLPELEPGLYTCTNRPLDNGAFGMWCYKLDATQARTAYNSVTFFTAYKPEMFFGQTLFLDERDVIELPEVFVVGFKPSAVDTPVIETFPASDEDVLKVIGKYITNGCLPYNEEVTKNLFDYLVCNEVTKCILDDPLTTIRSYLPSLRTVLSRIRPLCDRYLDPAGKSKQNFLKKAFQSVKTVSKSVSRAMSPSPSVSPLQAGEPIPSPLELMRFMKLMLNKLLDPCILMDYAETKKDKTEINQACNVSCQFLNTAYDSFTGWFGYKCGNIKGGQCSQGVCMCDQQMKPPVEPSKRKVKMLACDNMFRKKVNSVVLVPQPLTDLPTAEEEELEEEDLLEEDRVDVESDSSTPTEELEGEKNSEE